MVIGDDPEGQLAPFDENEEVEEYCTGEVSEEDKQEMMEFYAERCHIGFHDFGLRVKMY